jgi:hypothetical protein
MDLTREFNRLVTYLCKKGRFPTDSISRDHAAQYYRTTTGKQQKAAQALFWLLRWRIRHRAAHLACYALEEGKDAVGVYLAVNRQQMVKRQARNESTADQKQRLNQQKINITGYQARAKQSASQSLQAVD